MSARGESDLMTPAEVAAALRVDVKTVARWAKMGRLNAIRTPGGHRRYPVQQINALRAVIAEGETALSSTQVATICDALSHGPDPRQAKERVLKVLSAVGPGSVIRVTG